MVQQVPVLALPDQALSVSATLEVDKPYSPPSALKQRLLIAPRLSHGRSPLAKSRRVCGNSVLHGQAMRSTGAQRRVLVRTADASVHALAPTRCRHVTTRCCSNAALATPTMACDDTSQALLVPVHPVQSHRQRARERAAGTQDTPPVSTPRARRRAQYDTSSRPCELTPKVH